MYKGFVLNNKNNELCNFLSDIYINSDANIMSYKNILDEITSNIELFLSANKIKNKYFRPIKADVFISHSHDDKELAHKLATWLGYHGISSFIDSDIWGHYADIAKNIAAENFYNQHDKIRTYIDISHLLNISLMDMIDRCPYFFFIKSSNSLDSKNITYSPWIYSELKITHYIQKRSQRIEFSRESAMLHLKERAYVPIGFTANTSHLIPLNIPLLEVMEEVFNDENFIDINPKEIFDYYLSDEFVWPNYE